MILILWVKFRESENINEIDNLILYKNLKWSENTPNEPEPLQDYTKEDIKKLDEN